jgi:hypothetical protein
VNDEDGSVVVEHVNDLDDAIALTASLSPQFAAANLARGTSSGTLHHPFNLPDRASMLGGVVKVPAVPAEFMIR